MLTHNKVLFISYYFPPTGGGGVQRALKFVKYLSAFGWKPVVLSAIDSMVEHNDESLFHDLPHDVSVHRVRRLPLLPFVDKFRINEKRGYDKNGRPVLVKSRNRFFMPFTYIVNRLYDLTRYLANNFLYIPDEHIGWLPGSVVKGVRLVKEHDLQMIFATGNPWTSFLTALFVSRLTGIPFVIDFRDPWTLDPYFKSPGIIHKWLNDRFEKLCVHYSDKVLFTCDGCMKTYQRKYLNEPATKFLTLTHGYETDDFKGIPKFRTGKFIISYIGAFYPQYLEPLDAFFRAVAGILKRDPELGRNLQINFVGNSGSALDRYLEWPGIRDVVSVIGYLGHKNCIQHMINSSLLLLFQDKYCLQTPGKIFEYLAARHPILALAPEKSYAAALLQEMNAGMCVNQYDVAGIEKMILYFYQGKWKHPMNYDITRYERKKLAGRLADIFDSIIA